MVPSAVGERQPSNDERDVGAGQVGVANEANVASPDDAHRSSPCVGAGRSEARNLRGLSLV